VTTLILFALVSFLAYGRLRLQPIRARGVA
jgi:hypothetical protein